MPEYVVAAVIAVVVLPAVFWIGRRSVAAERSSPSRRFELVDYVVAVGVVGVVAMIGYVGFRIDITDLAIELPIVIIIGAVGLILILAMIAFVFQKINLANPNEALGLPTGSVRALIALSLIILFAMQSIFLFEALSRGGNIQTLTNLSPQEVENIAKSAARATILHREQTGPSDAPRFTIEFIQAANPAAEDFAKQILTMLGTLVTAVASFYFGANTASNASPAERKDQGKGPDAKPSGGEGEVAAPKPQDSRTDPGTDGN